MSEFDKVDQPKYTWSTKDKDLDTTVKKISIPKALLSGVSLFFFVYAIVLFVGFSNNAILPSVQPSIHPFAHILGFPLLLLQKLLPILSFDFIENYRVSVFMMMKNGHQSYVMIVYLLAIGLGLFAGIWGFIKGLVPSGGVKQTAGKVLLKGKEAYDELKREFTFLSKDGRGARLVVGADKGFNPTTQYIGNLKPGTFIELPEKVRRAHSMYIGGTGRGKTQLIYYREVAQLRKRLENGENLQLMIADTPKGDYSKYFTNEEMVLIAPHEEGKGCGAAWDIAEDLSDALLANNFWKGKIPSSDSDPIWSNAAIAVATGATRYLQVLTGKNWNYGLLAQVLTTPGHRLDAILSQYYPEAKQILQSAHETLSSVLFNLATYTQDIVQLARIYDGYEYKRPIQQATCKLLYTESGIELISNALRDNFDEESIVNRVLADPNSKQYDAEKTMKANKIMIEFFVGLVRMMNLRFLDKSTGLPNWSWEDMASQIDDYKLATTMMQQRMNISISNEELKYWDEMVAIIRKYSAIWDKYEDVEKFSIKAWFTGRYSEKNKRLHSRKVLILKPSETYPTLTEGLIRGMLYYSNSVILGKLKDSSTRKVHILIDEFQSYGNISDFIKPALSLYRSRGVSVTLAFQDLAQMVQIYKQEFVDFMNANIANIVILGVNDGFTANKLSDLFGQKKIRKLHRNRGGDGKVSEDYQEHEEKVVYTNIWNKLGANDATRSIHYMNAFAGLNPIYILKAPIINYETRYEPVEASWVDRSDPHINFRTGLINKVIEDKKQKKDVKLDEIKTRSQIDKEIEEKIDSHLDSLEVVKNNKKSRPTEEDFDEAFGLIETDEEVELTEETTITDKDFDEEFGITLTKTQKRKISDDPMDSLRQEILDGNKLF